MSDESMPDHPKNDRCGGAAFPMVSHGAWNAHQYADAGMSLRDWFAGQALAEATREIWAEHKFADVAKRAYGIADAMLAARRDR